MKNDNKMDLMADLHRLLAETLLSRVNDPEVKASDLNVARQFLKDNGIDALPVKDSPLLGLIETLPNFSNQDGTDLDKADEVFKQ